MVKIKNARFLFFARSIAWSLAFYLLLMTLLNWEDLAGKKREVVVTWEQSQQLSSHSCLPTHKTKGNVHIVDDNG